MDSNRTLNELFRYLFPGLLFFGLARWIFGFCPLKDALAVLAGAFVVGAIIYPLYHEFVYVYPVTWLKEFVYRKVCRRCSYRALVSTWVKEVCCKDVNLRKAERLVGIFRRVEQEGKWAVPDWVSGAVHFLYVASLQVGVAGVLCWLGVGASHRQAYTFPFSDGTLAFILPVTALLLLAGGLGRDRYAEEVEEVFLKGREYKFKSFLKLYFEKGTPACHGNVEQLAKEGGQSREGPTAKAVG